MSGNLNLSGLAAALSALPGYRGTTAADLAVLNVKGLAHDHVTVAGRGLLLRVPKQSQFGLTAGDNLAYQAACFVRVNASGFGPKLHGVLRPQARLAMGALLVEMIPGRPPRLPEDLPLLAEAMARVHALPVPPPASRAPLHDHRDPVGGALAEVEAQAKFLDPAGLEPAARAEIDDELAWARSFGRESAGRAQPVTLVLTDTHPGNFLIEEREGGGAGRAVIVDLEKALYGSPATDLAHATLYSSTTWDPDIWAALSLDEVAAFYRHYLGLVGDELARDLAPWLVPLRRITLLRAITWCVKWRVLHARARRADRDRAESAEDWSAENTDPAIIAHVANRVADYLAPETLKAMRGEWLGRPGLLDLI
ncbi:MAG: phosphotransferase family protein [Alphaproteobacteria bacterium]